ncbi:MAG: protein-export chaperone SecB [Rickettsiales bacterium]|jgi:preprotein translocase subunit SecB|nr:protein-export chaperone SecB [Rickettsiales bacterium]
MISKRTGAEIVLNTQYVKDFSFENPKAPEVYALKNLKPNMEVSVDINAGKLQNELFEVELALNVTAKNADATLFVIELIYAGIFSIKNVSDSIVQENLFIDCPTMIYPFARRIIYDSARDANFSPLMLDIIDFEELYNSKKDTLKK